MNSINVIFLWHFHQPYYKDDLTGEILMPWARLHATKDYRFMGEILKNYPKVHAVFNYSPSLLAQLDDYVNNYDNTLKNEKFLSISAKKIIELTADDKLFILNKLFPACSSGKHFLEKSERFKQLYYRLRDAGTSIGLGEKISLFTNQDYLDIIVLFNIMWIDPISINSDEFLTALKNKDKKFTVAEKNILIEEKIPQILNKIFPLITELASNGQIELSASPYYHPILPLLCDTDIAHFHDGIVLPKPFRHPEDADYQIKSAINYFDEKLNYKINGMWPSEGSVSERTLKLFIDNNINWIATDEEILFNSIGVNFSDIDNRKLLYRPYVVKRGKGYSYIFFRDKMLSDLIGFKYSNYEPKAAAEDLINNLKNIAISLHDYNKNDLPVVSIILDGENAWEYYKNNGYDFFNYLYEGLSNNTEIINTVTAGEYIKKVENTLKITDDVDKASNSIEKGKTGVKIKRFLDIRRDQGRNIDFSEIYNIPTIYPGSWINHNFRIWIGDSEDNKAWDLLSKTRSYLVNKTNDSIREEGGLRGEYLKAAWKQLYIAEGSDYNWWYGEDRTSGIDEEYDLLYRTHIINVYKFLNDNPPDDCFIPVLEEKRAVKPHLDIVSFINPKIDGVAGSYFEWLGSAVYFPSVISGKAMAHTDRFIKRLYYGFNESTFFVRFDFFKKENQDLSDKILNIKFINPANIEINIEFHITDNNILNLSIESSLMNKNSVSRKSDLKVVFKDILEAAVPLSIFNIDSLGNIYFYAILTYKDNPLVEIERFPVNGYFETTVPNKNFEIVNWLV